jgi:probable HAF family extracellular repeat protein
MKLGKLACVVLICSADACFAAAPAYTILDLGGANSSGKGWAFPDKLNNLGQVAGQGIGPYFLTRPNQPIDPATDVLGPANSASSYVEAYYSVNDVGQVVGLMNRAAFLRNTDGTVRSLGTFGGPESGAVDINNAGQVAGTALLSNNLSRAFRTAPNPTQLGPDDDLGTLPGATQSFARAINSTGQVAGSSTFPNPDEGNVINHAFRTTPTGKIDASSDLGPSLIHSWAGDINDSGQVVGVYDNGQGNRAFLTAPNAPIDPLHDNLGSLGGPRSGAIGVNNLGQVVGDAELASGLSALFLYTDGVMYNLDDLLPPHPSMRLRTVNDINDRGQITGSAFVGLEVHGFLMTPAVPEPSGALSILSGLLALGLTRVRGRTDAHRSVLCSIDVHLCPICG